MDEMQLDGVVVYTTFSDPDLRLLCMFQLKPPTNVKVEIGEEAK